MVFRNFAGRFRDSAPGVEELPLRVLALIQRLINSVHRAVGKLGDKFVGVSRLVELTEDYALPPDLFQDRNRLTLSH